MRRRGFQCASAAQSAQMVSEVVRKPTIKQIAENMGRSRNAVAHHVKQGPKRLRGRPLELPCLPRSVFVFVSLAAPRMAQSEGRAHVESCRAVSHRRSTRSLKRGLFPCSGVTVVVRAGRPGCTTRLEHAKQLTKVLLDLQETNPCTSAYEVRTGTKAGSALGTAFVLRWLCRRRLISRA